MDINDTEVIDLCTPVNAIPPSATVITNNLAQISHSILPNFPASIENDDRPDLRLAPVPGK